VQLQSSRGCDGGIYLGATANASHVSITGSWRAATGYALYSAMMIAGQHWRLCPKLPPAKYDSETNTENNTK
jgi:hypothetical protein